MRACQGRENRNAKEKGFKHQEKSAHNAIVDSLLVPLFT